MEEEREEEEEEEEEEKEEKEKEEQEEEEEEEEEEENVVLIQAAAASRKRKQPCWIIWLLGPSLTTRPQSRELPLRTKPLSTLWRPQPRTKFFPVSRPPL